MTKCLRLVPVLLTALCALALLVSCTPRKQGASSQSFYAAGRANFNISVAPPMQLFATDARSASVPSDVTISPSARFRYAVFSDNDGGPVARHAHIILSELSQYEWRWEVETWAMPEALSYQKEKIAGKYWTIQMMPVFSSQDWFSALWAENKYEIPDFWLAKRWSATPEPHIRIVAEYREPAPLCMRERLADARPEDRSVPSLKGKELWRDCDNEIREFSQRADSAFLFDRAENLPDEGLSKSAAAPSARPNMAKLVGKAEHAESYSTSSRD